MGEYDERELKRLQQAGRDALGVMERHLRENEFFSRQYGVADIALYAYTHKAHEGGQTLSDFPAIITWLAWVRAQPGHVTMEVV